MRDRQSEANADGAVREGAESQRALITGSGPGPGEMLDCLAVPRVCARLGTRDALRVGGMCGGSAPIKTRAQTDGAERGSRERTTKPMATCGWRRGTPAARERSGHEQTRRACMCAVVTECERGHNHKGARERCIVNCRFPLSGVEPVSPRPAWTGERGCVRLTTREPARRRAHGATVRTDGPDRGRNTDHAVHRSSHIGQRAGIQKRPAGLTLKPYRIT